MFDIYRQRLLMEPTSAFTYLFFNYFITYFLHLNCLSMCYFPFLSPFLVHVCFLSLSPSFSVSLLLPLPPSLSFLCLSFILSFRLLQSLSSSSFLMQCLTLSRFHSLAGHMCFSCQSCKQQLCWLVYLI